MINNLKPIETIELITNIYRNSSKVLKELLEEHKDIKFTTFLHGQLNGIMSSCEFALKKMDYDYAMQLIREVREINKQTRGNND